MRRPPEKTTRPEALVLMILLATCMLAACSENTRDEEAHNLPTTPFEGDVDPRHIGATIRGGAEQRIGSALACADLNGDGADELIVGTPYDSTNETEAGGVLIFAGPPIGELTADQAAATILGTRRFAAAGWAVTGVGDMGNDGREEIAIGAYADTRSGAVTGSVFVFEGPLEGTMMLDDANAILMGSSEFDKAGWAVSPAGDLNGDGLADLAVGAYTADADGAEDAGVVYVAMGPLGGEQQLSASPVIIRGDREEAYVGWSVAGLGDIDGDGFDDLAVGGSSHDLSALEPSAWVFKGPLSRGELSVTNADATFVASSGFARVASAGNMTGSGNRDLVVGNYEHVGPNGRSGAVWVFAGTTLDSMLSPLNATRAFVGEADGDAAGWWVAPAGDIDGDGLSDLLVGSPNADVTGADSGAVYILRSGPDSDSMAQVSGLAALDAAGSAVLGGCDFDGNGAADIAVGAPGAGSEPPFAPDGGEVYVYYGQ